MGRKRPTGAASAARSLDHDRRRRGGRGRRGAHRLGGGGRRRTALVAEPELDVLAEFRKLLLEPPLGVLEFLDPAVRLPKLLLEPVDADNQRRGLVLLGACLTGNVGRRLLAVEEIGEALRESRPADEGRGDDESGARAKKWSQWSPSPEAVPDGD